MQMGVYFIQPHSARQFHSQVFWVVLRLIVANPYIPQVSNCHFSNSDSDVNSRCRVQAAVFAGEILIPNKQIYSQPVIDKIF
jgi:hypothetical protein